jgi:ATP-dependent DNA ligase
VDGGRLTTGLRYELRRRLLEQLDLDGAAATVVPSWPGDDADVLLEACERLDVEGVVLKRSRRAMRLVVGRWRGAR